VGFSPWVRRKVLPPLHSSPLCPTAPIDSKNDKSRDKGCCGDSAMVPLIAAKTVGFGVGSEDGFCEEDQRSYCSRCVRLFVFRRQGEDKAVGVWRQRSCVASHSRVCAPWACALPRGTRFSARCSGAPKSCKAIRANGPARFGPQRESKRLRRTGDTPQDRAKFLQ
jgi:hypothetical protein